MATSYPSTTATEPLSDVLQEDPFLNWDTFDSELQSHALALCSSLSRYGLLSALLPPTDYANLPGNMLDPGNPDSTPPTPPTLQFPVLVCPHPGDLSSTATTGVYHVYELQLANYNAYTTGMASIYKALLALAGPFVKRTVLADDRGRVLGSVPELYASLSTKYSVKTPEVIKRIKAALATTRLTAGDNVTVTSFFAKRRLHIASLTRTGYVSQDADLLDQLLVLCKKVPGAEHIDSVINLFETTHTDAATDRTAQALTALIAARCTNESSAPSQPVQSSAFSMTTQLVSSFQDHDPTLAAAFAAALHAVLHPATAHISPAAASQHPTAPAAPRQPPAPPRAPVTKPFYCFWHGPGNHASAACQFMAADQARFTPAMRAAIASDSVPNGRTTPRLVKFHRK